METNQINQDVLECLTKAFSTLFKGEEKARKSADIILEVNMRYSAGLIDRSFKRYVEHIRKNDLMSPAFILGDTHKGYWLSEDPKEQWHYINKELKTIAVRYDNVSICHRRLRDSGSKNPGTQANLFT